jgi:hypothetical protein
MISLTRHRTASAPSLAEPALSLVFGAPARRPTPAGLSARVATARAIPRRRRPTHVGTRPREMTGRTQRGVTEPRPPAQFGKLFEREFADHRNMPKRRVSVCTRCSATGASSRSLVAVHRAAGRSLQRAGRCCNHIPLPPVALLAESRVKWSDHACARVSFGRHNCRSIACLHNRRKDTPRHNLRPFTL